MLEQEDREPERREERDLPHGHRRGIRTGLRRSQERRSQQRVDVHQQRIEQEENGGADEESARIGRSVARLRPADETAQRRQGHDEGERDRDGRAAERARDAEPGQDQNSAEDQARSGLRDVRRPEPAETRQTLEHSGSEGEERGEHQRRRQHHHCHRRESHDRAEERSGQGDDHSDRTS